MSLSNSSISCSDSSYDNSSIGDCEVCGCDNDIVDRTECCYAGLCNLHYVVYRACSRKICQLYNSEICATCLEKNGYQCETCKITFCDNCNTEDIQKLEGCKCLTKI